jgi:CRP/FNR family transcriptional regulator
MGNIYLWYKPKRFKFKATKSTMLEKTHIERIYSVIPFFENSDNPVRRDFVNYAYFVKIPAGKEIFAEGDEVNGIALLISGVVRVFKLSPTGREITLYRFGEGESCVITANAILHRQEFPAIAEVEKDAEAMMIPADKFKEWVRTYEPWRDFVFNLVSQRLISVMEVVEELAFQRMDKRVASFLLARSQVQNPVKITHQEIANEIGSSREVVSRLLEDFAEKQLILLSRGKIEVNNFGGLKSISSM